MAKRRTKLDDTLRRKIDESGMSRYAICKATGIAEASMSRFMSGQLGLSMDAIDALMEYFDLELVPKRKRKGR